jgi:putative CocE/NonD family hydrolase
MMITGRRLVVAIAIALVSATTAPVAQQPAFTAEQEARRWALENELQSLAIVDRKVMMPMRDGVRLATDIYRPKNAAGRVPIVFVKTPYNFNFWDVRNGVPADMTPALTAVKRGYAYVIQNERGHFFSEGHYDILGPPTTDGYDALEWLSKQPWSSGRIGATGCSSTAEYQMAALGASGHPAFAAMNIQGFGAGVGRVGPYYEQGNWYRGGAVQMLFIAWLYGEQNQVRPMFPPTTSQEELIHASKFFNLAQQAPRVDWSKALTHLPVQDIMKAAGGPKGIFADAMPVATGGRMIQRTPNDPGWYKGGLWHDNMPLDVPGLWFMSWYDVSVGPNLEMFKHVQKNASRTVADQQWAVIAPVAHCAYTRATENTVVGERSMGDARLDYQELVFGFFDKFLKGEQNTRIDRMPKVTYFTMGVNRWQTSSTWPPEGAEPVTFFLSSNGKANTMSGDGRLTAAAPDADRPDNFTYDPMNPVPSYGGNVCCTGNAVQAGAFDQRKMETRNDILVYTSEPFKEGVELTGPIVPTLYVSSDAKDTDFTVKVIDVEPDGRAYNLDESIQRMRYRDGYDKPLVWMEKGKVYKVTLQPLNTSNYFAPGHRLRIEVSSSNFPRFDRNLNTGGNNYDETTGVVAHNAVHHSKQYPSQLSITVVKRPTATRDR